jgi:hypothetical protein
MFSYEMQKKCKYRIGETLPVTYCGRDAPYKCYYHVNVFGQPKAVAEYSCEEHKRPIPTCEEDDDGQIEIHCWDEKTQSYEIIWYAEDVEIKDYETYE